MARTVRDVRLDSRAARARLLPRKKPYYRVIETGKHLGYYKGARTGTWIARALNGRGYVEERLGMADDTLDANGVDVLSFSEAQAEARKWFDRLVGVEFGVRRQAYTVSRACDDYLADYKHRRCKDEYNTTLRLIRIKAALGDIEVRRLTATQIKTWHRTMGEVGRLSRSRSLDENGERKRLSFDPNDGEAQRRRLATANRNLTVLKAVLNLAFRNQEELGISIPAKTAWQSASPTRAVDAPKVRYLSDAEAVRLLNASPAGFRDLVAGALLTGCRYGELCRLRARDFDADAAAVRIEESKAGKGRSVSLTDEGVSHFSRLARGKSREELLFTQPGGEAWGPSHQIRRMKAACRAASIAPPVGFHILRHTYGSRLAMKGAPMGVIAQQLGHADTRMTERHYAHLAPSYVSEVVRGLLGDIGLPASPDNVTSIV